MGMELLFQRAVGGGIDERFADENIKVGRTAGGWVYEAPDGAAGLCIRAAHDRGALCFADDLATETTDIDKLRLLFRTAVECAFPFHDTISLHAACVEIGGRAVAFTGHSGIGKSTRARAWIERLDAEFISGDRPAIRLENGGAIACGVPWDGKEQIFRDVERPLAAIFEVRRAPFRALRRLTPEQARKILMQQCFIPMWDNDAAAAAMSVIRRLSGSAPIYRLFCGPDGDDAAWAHDAIFSAGGQTNIEEEDWDMKIKEGFVLREIVGEHIVMPVGENINKFEGALVLNEVSALLWENLQAHIAKADLLKLLLAEFEVDAAVAERDLDAFLDQLREHGLLVEERAAAQA